MGCVYREAAGNSDTDLLNGAWVEPDNVSLTPSFPVDGGKERSLAEYSKETLYNFCV